jgi:hypothetical protein
MTGIRLFSTGNIIKHMPFTGHELHSFQLVTNKN